MNEMMTTDPMDMSPIEDVLRGMMRPWRMMEITDRAPAIRIDVSETDAAYQVKAEIPGVRKEDIDVRIEGNQVTLSAEIKKEHEDKKNGRLLRSERLYGFASRSVSLGCAVDEAKAEAHYENGVLSLSLPKKGGTAAKRISIH